MAYKVTTAVSVEPITLAEARLHLRLGSDETSEDGLIASLIVMAREVAERYAGCALARQTLEQSLDEFPCDGGEILLDMPPVASVTSIKYDDLNAVEQTLDASRWHFSAYGTQRRVSLTYGSWWPPTHPQADAVRIRFVTGYATLPGVARSAMLLTIGHYFENRQDVFVGDGRIVALELPKGTYSLLDTLKVYG
jgi:uncharacterized phiE125 gp8 family phage protein